MANLPNYYEILGVAEDADDVIIKKAFRDQAKQYSSASEPGARQLKEAYDVLTDPHKRSQYDAMRVRERGGMGTPHATGAARWEYLTLKSSRNYGTTKYYINGDNQRELKDARFSDVINMIGEEGWEMVGVSNMGNENIYIFKRAMA
jgi:DnaJ-class molecular chaperone